jgi:hypothetical protein
MMLFLLIYVPRPFSWLQLSNCSMFNYNHWCNASSSFTWYVTLSQFDQATKLHYCNLTGTQKSANLIWYSPWNELFCHYANIVRSMHMFTMISYSLVIFHFFSWYYVYHDQLQISHFLFTFPDSFPLYFSWYYVCDTLIKKTELFILLIMVSMS